MSSTEILHIMQLPITLHVTFSSSPHVTPPCIIAPFLYFPLTPLLFTLISFHSPLLSSSKLLIKLINYKTMAYTQPAGRLEGPPHRPPQLSHQVAKTATAVTVGGSLMVLSGLTLAATVIGLVLATPLLVIFSPVLVPAAITVFLIFAGFLSSGGFGATASFIFYWMYRYATGKHPIGADQLDRAREKIAHAAKEMKDRAEHLGHQTQQQIKGAVDT